MKKLERKFGALWHKIKTFDHRHLGFHFENYVKLTAGTIGMAFFGFMVFMSFVYLPVLIAESKSSPGIVSGDVMGLLFRVWPLISFVNAILLSAVALVGSLLWVAKSFSFYDSHYRRIVELRTIINDAEEGIEGNGRGSEWIKDLNFEDGDKARKVANFVFLGKRLGLKTKCLVEAKFKV